MHFVTHRLIATVALCQLSTVAFSNETLCSQSEKVIFSCPIQAKKIVSVCVLGNNQEEAKIAYRYGTPTKIDLSLSEDPSRKPRSVEYNDEQLGRAYNTFVRFKSGKYSYTVQQSWDGCPTSPDDRCIEESFFAGVKVFKSGRLISSLECSGPRESLDASLLEKFHVPVSNQWPE